MQRLITKRDRTDPFVTDCVWLDVEMPFSRPARDGDRSSSKDVQ